MGVFDPFLGGDFGVFTLSLPTSGGILGPFWGVFGGFLGGFQLSFPTSGTFRGGPKFGGVFRGFWGILGHPPSAIFNLIVLILSDYPFEFSLSSYI